MWLKTKTQPHSIFLNAQIYKQYLKKAEAHKIEEGCYLLLIDDGKRVFNNIISESEAIELIDKFFKG